MKKDCSNDCFKHCKREQFLIKGTTWSEERLILLDKFVTDREDWVANKHRNIPVNVIFLDERKEFNEISHLDLK